MVKCYAFGMDKGADNVGMIKMVKARQFMPASPPDMVAQTLSFVQELKVKQQAYDLSSTGNNEDDGLLTKDQDIRSLSWSYKDRLESLKQFSLEQWIY